ncbi:putative reverse transcriptase domain-containing protein, partial [Tanacetum coccineum]
YITKVASAPPPPPSFLPPLIRPPRTRASMAQMRAAIPSTYHPLLPSRTPPLLTIPLPAPSTSRRADIPEAKMLPRKRLLLTAPRPGCEVGESCTVAATRQPRPTMACRVDCSSVDTVETRVRDTERRRMVALEVVNLRVSYQVDIRSRESSEFYSRHHDAQKDRPAMRAEIKALARSEAYSRALDARITVLETQARRHEWQHQDADDRAIEHIIQNGTKEKDHEAMIDQGITAVLATRDANTNGVDSHNSGTGARRNERATHECTYPDFMKCQPLNFKGTEGVVELTQWIEKMETTELKKKMTDKYCLRTKIKKLEVKLWELKVKGTNVIRYNQRFQELALLCGRMFPKESDKIEKYISGLPDMIHGSVVASKHKTMQEATKIAIEVMNKRIRTFADRQIENKRKSGEKKPYGGSKPLCAKCNYHHDGTCDPKCHKCNKVGHFARDCRSVGNANNANNHRGTGSGQKPTCFECGVQGHFKRECSKLKNNKNYGNQVGNGKAPAMVYVVGHTRTNPDSNIMTGMFLLNNRYVSILFDIGADRSFVSTAFSS